MSKPQLFIQTYVVCACIALGSFLSVHGGLAGDFDRQLISTSDPHAKNVYAASLLFNRWRIHFPSEPFIFRAFVIANAPADIFARLTFKGIQVISIFQDPFPWGLSFPSYPMILMLLFGGVQWYLIGRLADILWIQLRGSRDV